MYNTLTWSVMKSCLTHVWDKKIRNGLITLETQVVMRWKILPAYESYYYSAKQDELRTKFIFQPREYSCNITHDILFLIYNGYF